jgi:hypothetical protein
MNGGRPWMTTDDQRLRDLVQLGLGLSEIAAQMDRSQSVIRRHVKKLKINIARGRNGMTVSRLVELGLKAKGK